MNFLSACIGNGHRIENHYSGRRTIKFYIKQSCVKGYFSEHNFYCSFSKKKGENDSLENCSLKRKIIIIPNSEKLYGNFILPQEVCLLS